MYINKEYYFRKWRRDFPLSLIYISTQYFFSFLFILLLKQTLGKNFLLDEVVSLEPQLDF